MRTWGRIPWGRRRSWVRQNAGREGGVKRPLDVGAGRVKLAAKRIPPGPRKMAEPGEIEMPEPHHVPSHERAFFNLIAVTVALLSAFLAVTKVKSDQTVQGMLAAKTDSVDAWNEYQAKRIRLHVDQAMLVQSKALRSLLNGDAASEFDKDVGKTAERAKRYEGELGDLKSKAEAFEHKTEALHARHER